MKRRKIRGHHKIQREIEDWAQSYQHQDLSDYFKRGFKRNYAKIYVSPWCDISFRNSEYPQPKGYNRKAIIAGLFLIYDSWKNQLEALGIPYYLSMWLYDQRFSKSQVVCAIDDEIDFYKNTFHQPEQQKTFPVANYGKFLGVMNSFDWVFAYDEELIPENEVGQPEDYDDPQEYLEMKRWFNKLLKRRNRFLVSDQPELTPNYYALRYGDVWIGMHKR